MAKFNEQNAKSSAYKCGTLPASAPLSVAYIPYQEDNPPLYDNNKALSRGTLFPGLDLPFMNIANKNNPLAGTPLGDLMALDFVLTELNLYLDTHSDDADAFALFKSVTELKTAAYDNYVKNYGPVCVTDTVMYDNYNWLHDPWPWEYCEEGDR